MTISPQLQAEILRLYHVEHWPVGTIARQLHLHHSTVRRVIESEGELPEKKKRPSKLDPYLPFMLETLDKYPRLTASRLFRMALERGYAGKESHFRAMVAKIRPRGREAYLRLRTLPGDEGQVDWGHFGRYQIDRVDRPLSAFVMVLSHSRAIFLRFFLSQSLEQFLLGHEKAFEHFGALPRIILYDNLKTAVIERAGEARLYNRQFLAFCAHYRYQPRAVAPGRGNEKGRVERAIRFIRSSFFPARRFSDLADLNRQATKWSLSVAMERRWPEDKRLSVREAFESEKEKLLPLPGDRFPCESRTEAVVPKTPYVRFDRNDYSVPHILCGRTVVVLAGESSVRILHEGKIAAEHVRSYERGAQVEEPQHVEELRREKRAASKSASMQTLTQAAPSSQKLLEELGRRGQPLGRATRALTELFYTYGAQALESAIDEALRAEAPHLHAITHLLERDRQASGRPVARPLPLPDDPRIRGVVVTPHELSSYDQITKEQVDDEEDDRKRGAT